MYRQYLAHLLRLSRGDVTGVHGDGTQDGYSRENTPPICNTCPESEVRPAPPVPPAPPPPPPPPQPAGVIKETAKPTQAMFDEIDELTRLMDETTRMIEETQDRGLAKLPTVSPALMGDTTVSVPTLARVVRIFTSSTFTDTKFERNQWMSEAYPRLRTFCQERGYEFQVVDMRWGVRDEAMDDHSTTDLCLRELRLCQKLSTGPNFVTLLSHKYGYRSLPREIESEEFDKLMGVIESSENKHLLNNWYQKDSNAVPPVYVLSSISKHLPDFVSQDKEACKAAKSQWWEESDTMQEALGHAAKLALEENEAIKYVISVTEKEIQMGLLSLDAEEVAKGCVWFRRNIANIELQESSYQLSRYIECLGAEEKVNLARGLLNDLKDRIMTTHLHRDNIITYNVSWSDKGINPELLEHKEYLHQITDDFIKKITGMVMNAIEVREAMIVNDVINNECLSHIRFCQEKCENFHGRETTLQKIKSYMTGGDRYPLVLHGRSGSGKTSIMAKIASLASSCRSNPKFTPAVIIRFIGTTPGSSNVTSLLTSLIQQIGAIYNLAVTTHEDHNALVKEFWNVLSKAKAIRPLVIILDSLDQLEPANNSHSLEWLPAVLKANVKIVLSTLEEEEYECFPILQQKLQNSPHLLVPVPVLEETDINDIVESWLRAHHRTLTTGQMETLTKTFDHCPVPLFLKLCFDQACKWTSFTPPDHVTLLSTIRDSIDLLFSQLEVKHGGILVSHALGYLTAASNGLSESELEDILSCDDVVLNDVYVYWTPPIRRLPPLLLVRLRTDLQEYIVERGADGVRVMCWYHRQFIEAARARYCGEHVIRTLHGGLAEFFSGKWSNGNKKLYTDRSGQPGLEDRHPAVQSLKHGDKYNTRKLNNLPFHRTMANHMDELKMECLLNIDFLQAKMDSSVRNVVSDYQLAKRELPYDYPISTVSECIQLSKQALLYDSHQLALQLRDRLGGDQNEELMRLCKQCQNMTMPHLIPDQEILVKPGGQMVFVLSDHTAEVTGLDISTDGRTIVTCADDDEQSVKFWNVEEGTLIRSLNKLGESPYSVRYMAADSLVLVEYTDCFKAVRVSGEMVYTLDKETLYRVAGKDKTILALFTDEYATLYDTYTGKRKCRVKQKKRSRKYIIDDPDENHIHGSQRYILVVQQSLYHVAYVDVEREEFSDWVEVFQQPPDDASDVPDLTVDMVAVAPDEKTFVVSSVTECNLIFYSIDTMQKIRIIKGSSDDVAQYINFTPDSKLLYYGSMNHVVVYDMETEERQEVLSHLSHVGRVVCTSWKTIVTLCEDDMAVRIWDVTRQDRQKQADKTILGIDVSHLCTLPNPRYISMVVRTDRKKSSVGGVLVYDLVTREIIRRGNMDDGLPRAIMSIGEQDVLLATDGRKIKALNLDRMEVTRTFEGKLCPYGRTLEFIKAGKEMLTLTRGGHGFKAYDVESGRTVSLIHSPPEIRRSKNNKINQDSLKTNPDGVLVCQIEEGPILIFDYIRCICVHTIAPLSPTNVFWEEFVPQHGTYVALQTYKDYPVPDQKGNTEAVCCIGVYDTDKGEITRWCMDEEYFTMYKTQGTLKDHEVNVDNSMLLDDDRLVTASDDNILRVWNLKTGHLLKRLEGHRAVPKFVRNHDTSPYFVSVASLGEENAIRVWNKETLESVASYRMDHRVGKVQFCNDGHSLVCTTEDCSLIHWRLVLPGNTETSDLSSYPQSFRGQERDITLNLNDKEVDDRNDELDLDDDEEDDDNDDDDDDDCDDDEEDQERKEEEEDDMDDFSDADPDDYTDDQDTDDD